MRGTILYGPRDIRSEDRPEPTIIQATDAIIRLSATCICGSDLWPYRGIAEVTQPTPMGHEYCGVVEEVGKEVKNIKRGQFVVGSFATSDNTCVNKTVQGMAVLSTDLLSYAQPRGAFVIPQRSSTLRPHCKWRLPIYAPLSPKQRPS